jgi:hypothetical protein
LDGIAIYDACPMLLAGTDENPAHPVMSIFCKVSFTIGKTNRLA